MKIFAATILVFTLLFTAACAPEDLEAWQPFIDAYNEQQGLIFVEPVPDIPPVPVVVCTEIGATVLNEEEGDVVVWCNPAEEVPIPDVVEEPTLPENEEITLCITMMNEDGSATYWCEELFPGPFPDVDDTVDDGLPGPDVELDPVTDEELEPGDVTVIDDQPVLVVEDEEGELALLPVDVCLIKGNIGRAGARIYHSPGQANYEVTVITPEKGERWFCSAEEAEEAGWRAAQR